MCNNDIFLVFCTYFLGKLFLLEFDGYAYRTFFGLDLFTLGLVSIESDVIKQRIICGCENIAVFNIFIGVESLKILCCLLFRKRWNIKICIIGNGICLLECCRNFYLGIFEFIYSLGIFVINSDDCYSVLNTVDACDSLDLDLLVFR